MIVEVSQRNFEKWVELGCKLWPDSTELREKILKIINSSQDKAFLYMNEDEYIGFINVSLRNDYVEGSDVRPVGYVEGIYIEPQYRRQGIAKKLLNIGEEWAVKNNCRQMASDTQWDNITSQEFHTKVGFHEAGRIVCFIKNIKD